MKKTYVNPNMNISVFDSTDIITTSNTDTPQQQTAVDYAEKIYKQMDGVKAVIVF